jgi:hypothetical protein
VRLIGILKRKPVNFLIFIKIQSICSLFMLRVSGFPGIFKNALAASRSFRPGGGAFVRQKAGEQKDQHRGGGDQG